MFQKDRKINGAGLFLSVVNTYRFSEKSEIIALEFSVSNIKRLLLGIYKTPIQNYFFFFLIKLILCYGNFVERHSFRIVSGDSPETMRKLYLSKKFPHQEIR